MRSIAVPDESDDVARETPEAQGPPSASLTTGLAAGAFAGAFSAMNDFGATWLWLPMWSDRASFLVRLLAVQAPLGALVGFGLHALDVRLGARLTSRVAPLARSRLAGLFFALLASPWLVHVARALFTGGKMSKLPYKGPAIAAAAVVLVASTAIAVHVGRRLVELAATRSRAAVLAPLAFFSLAFATAKANQHVLPNLYGYLHDTLSITSFLLAFGGALASRAFARARGRTWTIGRRGGVALALGLVIAIFANLLTLEHNQNVRVALHDARAPHARSLMQALQPVLRVLVERDFASRARRPRYRLRSTWSGPPLPASEGAHVLIVTVDALRADHLGAYGYARGISPNIDAFARESVVFERAYTAAPHSSYSLCSLMTSEHVHELAEIGRTLPEETLATVLGASGYHTAAFYTLGIFHTEGERLRPYEHGAFGFSRHEHTNFRAEERTDVTLAEIDRIVERGEPPSLVWTHYFDVHEPYLDTSLGRDDADRYDAEIRNVDRAFARLLREARARLDRPLVVVLTADHGEEFRDHGGVYHGSTLYDEQNRVPLVVHAPSMPAARVAAPVSLVDLAPTLLGLVGVGPSPTMRGEDLRPYAMGFATDREPVFGAVAHKRMVVDWPHKLIADLRFDVYEVYDLAADPRERRNLASADPALLARLKGEVYGWLDGFEQGEGDPFQQALALGRLGDRRAVTPLSSLFANEGAPLDARLEAARLLGRLAVPSIAPVLVRALGSREPRVAAEAAIALGRLSDQRAREPLRGLVRSEDSSIRVRSAIALARLGDRAAVPALVEALHLSRDQLEREEAVRWLGRLRDPSAVDPLIQLIGDYRIRHLLVISLGQLGDPRAFTPLHSMLAWEHHTHIRNNLTRGLAELGDRRALPALVTLAARERELDLAAESLVRLGALEAGAVGGADFDPEAMRGSAGFSDCSEEPIEREWLYVGRTVCRSAASRDGDAAVFPIRVPEAVRDAHGGVVVILRARTIGSVREATARLRLGRTTLGPFELDAQFKEHRFSMPASALEGAHEGTFLLEVGARVEVDHVLLVPAALDG